MWELIKFELRKIFSNKLIYIVAAFILILFYTGPVTRYFEIKNDFGSIEQFESIAKKYVSDKYSYEEFNELCNKAKQKMQKQEELNKDERFLAQYANTIYKSSNDKKIVANGEMYNYDYLVDLLNNMKSEGKEDSYEYKSLKKAKDLYDDSLEEDKSVYLGLWNNQLDFNVLATLKLILLVVGLSRVFTIEYSSKVSYINLSSKKGRTTLNTAKLIASTIYGVVIFAYITLLTLINSFPLGLHNGDSPIRCINSSIVSNLSIKEYYFSCLAVSLFGVILISILIVTISLLSKNSIVSFGLPLALLFMSGMLQYQEYIGKYTTNFSIFHIIKARGLFDSYLTYNIFDRVVNYRSIEIIIGIISLVVLLIIYKKFSKSQRIA